MESIEQLTNEGNVILLEVCITLSILLVLLGNLIYAGILFQRRFHKVTSYIAKDSFKIYTDDLRRVIKKANGWLYLLIFFNCVNYTFGPWSIAFSMLCFLATASGENSLVAFCSVLAAISSSSLLFASPAKRYSAASNAWKQSQSEIDKFIIKWRTGDDQEKFRAELEELSKRVSAISDNTAI